MQKKEKGQANELRLYTDGACRGNPGPGGWGCVLIWKDTLRASSGYEAQTTNNRMELQAVIEGLSRLKKAVELDIYTDSKYVKNAFTDGWLDNWIKRGWKTSGGDPVKNVDLWQQLLTLTKKNKVTWHWVRGHSGDLYNEMCDQLARDAIDDQGGKDFKEKI